MILITSWESVCLISYSHYGLCITQFYCLARRNLRFKKALCFSFQSNIRKSAIIIRFYGWKLRIGRFCLLELEVAGSWDVQSVENRLLAKWEKKVPKCSRTFLYLSWAANKGLRCLCSSSFLGGGMGRSVHQ